jgi:DNA modification methylase
MASKSKKPENKLFYGDNLDILRLHVPDESVDLVYLDPPFNSNATYNVLFAEEDGTRAAAQIEAFGDTWRWDQASSAAYQEIVQAGGEVAKTMTSFKNLLGDSNMLAYLAMMAPRLVELKRVLKEDGSIYLHCDPTASHYLKLLMDSVFGPQNFRTEIIWKRSSAHSDTKQGRAQHGRIHDIIFFYTKGSEWNWTPVYTPYDDEYEDTEYRHVDEDGRRYKQTDLTAAKPGGDTSYEWRIKKPIASDGWQSDLTEEWKKPEEGWEYKAVVPYKGRFWAYGKENMTEFAENGLLHYRKTGMPRLKQYADDMPGISLQDIWTDIAPIGAKAAERLGYPTQKPVALLDRIISSSCPEDGVVLDPFCGCGTTIASAQKLGRSWIGIDITYLAVALMKSRLSDMEMPLAPIDYEVLGEPVSIEDAKQLAADDPYQFQWWALGLVGARPAEGKKGADKGIDGRIYFFDEGNKAKQVIISVKAGKVQVSHVRDLVGVLDREDAQIGVLISMNEPTKPMREEAASAGFYYSPLAGENFPRIQLLTIDDLLSGKRIERPISYGVAEMEVATTKKNKANDDQLQFGEDPEED